LWKKWPNPEKQFKRLDNFDERSPRSQKQDNSSPLIYITIGIRMNNKTKLGIELYIVVADDDIQDHQLIGKAVKKCNLNHIVTSVYNGVQLMNLLLKKEFYKTDTTRIPDLIILNLKMPVLDGFGALSEIKKHQELKNIPIYTLSEANLNYEKKAMSLGSRLEELNGLVMRICEEIGSQKINQDNRGSNA
jgi:CheY-like chemotaxis protein